MKKTAGFSILLILSLFLHAQDYFPRKGHWKRMAPAALGVDTVRLNDAIRFAIASESRNVRSMEENHLRTFAKEPFGEAIGPFKDRGDQTGLIIYKGYIIASWGEPERVDMTHSVTKSFLSATVGLAVEKGLIRDIHDPVRDYIDSVPWLNEENPTTYLHPFAGTHNQTITWENMLQQNSDWEGTLWGKPDWADRPDKDSTKWHNRKRNIPGTVYEYNDVRVNAMALAATWVWQKSLPAVLNEYIMKPIGASGTWRWNGYRNSWIGIGQKKIQVVSGGGHWGGGMFINAYDMARFGLLTLHQGKWKGRQILSANWIRQSGTPSLSNKGYGYMNYFLNTDRKAWPAAPANAFIHIGNGTNIVYADPEHELVMVIRWIENNQINEFIKKMLTALPVK